MNDGSPALVAHPPRPTPKPRVPSSLHCKGCLSQFDDHDAECNSIGRFHEPDGETSCKFRLSLTVSVLLCPNLDDSEMLPSHLARVHAPKTTRRKGLSGIDPLLCALRNAKELAHECDRPHLTGWPLWWRGDIVLEYCSRPDGIRISDALGDDKVPFFRFEQHTREQCFERLSALFCNYSHFGTSIPTNSECLALQIPSVVEFVWPSAIKLVIKGPSGDPVAVCYHDGSILWIADTGCGYHLVPEADVSRGKSVVVPNSGATRLHTANGEVDASECVKFSLSEIQLQKGLATILPQTPRVLSVGALCMDARATFHWPAGGTPFFTLHDGSIVWCEVHGRVPYLRTGGQSALTGLLGFPRLLHRRLTSLRPRRRWMSQVSLLRFCLTLLRPCRR
jgi:hypothetical protein